MSRWLRHKSIQITHQIYGHPLPLVPRALPPEVLGCWSADQVVASVTVLAARPSGALAAAEALVPELTRSAEAVVTVRTAGASGAAAPA